MAGSVLLLRAQEAGSGSRPKPPDEKRWQAVAPGRVEPVSGEIKIMAPIPGLIGEILVRAGDKVAAAEPLVRLKDREPYARLASAQAQIAMRKRARDDQAPSSRAADRRQAEDAVADAEQNVLNARSSFDRTAQEKHAGRAADADLEATRAALARAEQALKQRQADLAALDADPSTPLPSQAEGQLNVARAELLAVQAAIDKLTIRSPIGGTVLQVNGKQGEITSPSAPQPLVIVGDLSGLRVRAELDERDFGQIKIGQAVSVRPEAFRGREIPGTVSFIAPMVEPSRTGTRGQRNQTDIDVAEILIDLADPGPLAVGMKVDAYFKNEGAQH